MEIVPWERVADDWEAEFKGRGVEFDIVPPKLLPILAERGVEILPPHKGMGAKCNAAYEAWKNEHPDGPGGGVRESEEGPNVLYSEVSKEDKMIRDALVDRLRESGIEIIDDVEEGQRVLDASRRAVEILDEMRKRNQQQETRLPEEEPSFRGTAISSADGAKVLQNLDNAIKKYENISGNRTRSFIGDVAEAINAVKQGSNSRYADYTTVNGIDVTIRLSNHNAKTKNFDYSGRDNGISIVISRDPNKGIEGGGDAHIVEFFYPDKALNKADGKPLAEIIKSIKQSLYSGEYKDTTGLAQRQEVNEDVIREMRGWHGSRADFEAFDHSHMGEGEGAQAYGWGTYITEVDGIARSYANTGGGSAIQVKVAMAKSEYAYSQRQLAMLDERIKKIDEEIDNIEPSDEINVKKREDLLKQKKGAKNLRKRFEKRVAETKAEFDRLTAIINGAGNGYLYEVNIPENDGTNYLSWTDVVSSEEGGRIAEIIAKRKGGRKETYWPYYWNITGQDLIKLLARETGSPREASELLREAGFVGVVYPAMFRSGGRADGAKNYVIFNEGDAKIVNKTKLFRAANGDVYGFVKDGKIYIDPSVATSETPIHEYSHLWGDALKLSNPEAWQRLSDLVLKDQDVLGYVKKLYPELEGDELVNEVFAHYSGRRGRERLKSEYEAMMGKANGEAEKTTVVSLFNKLRQALDHFWQMSRDLFAGKADNIENISLDDFADMALNDLLGGVKPETRENPDIRYSEVDEDSQKLFDGAKRKFGVTNDIREAGYVLPDGSEEA